jgi:hypothetical protein
VLLCCLAWATASSNELILFSLLVFDYQGNIGFDISGLTWLDIVVIWGDWAGLSSAIFIEALQGPFFETCSGLGSLDFEAH